LGGTLYTIDEQGAPHAIPINSTGTVTILPATWRVAASAKSYGAPFTKRARQDLRHGTLSRPRQSLRRRRGDAPLPDDSLAGKISAHRVKQVRAHNFESPTSGIGDSIEFAEVRRNFGIQKNPKSAFPTPDRTGTP
jgi:hypothetical protein